MNVPNQHGSLTVKKSVGHFGSEVAAAVAADRARVRHVSGTYSGCQQILCWPCTMHEW